MQRLLLIVALMIAMPSFAETPASDASISELMALTDARAVLAKMPLLMTNMTQVLSTQMQSFMPALQKLVGEYVQKVRGAGQK